MAAETVIVFQVIRRLHQLPFLLIEQSEQAFKSPGFFVVKHRLAQTQLLPVLPDEFAVQPRGIQISGGKVVECLVFLHSTSILPHIAATNPGQA